MKLVRNDLVIVEVNDIAFLSSLPNFVVNELKFFYSDETSIQIFHSHDSINYFKCNDAIIDFEDVYKLPDAKIDNIIEKLKKDLSLTEKSASITSSLHSDSSNKELNSKNNASKLEYKIKTLEHFKQNRAMYLEVFAKYL